jgi:hypothetical protein
MKKYGLPPHETGMSYQTAAPENYALLLEHFPDHEGTFDFNQAGFITEGNITEAMRNFNRWFVDQRKKLFVNYLKSHGVKKSCDDYAGYVSSNLYTPDLTPFPEEECGTTKNPVNSAKKHFNEFVEQVVQPAVIMQPTLKCKLQELSVPDEGTLNIRRDLLRKEEENSQLKDDFRELDRKLISTANELVTITKQLEERDIELFETKRIIEVTKFNLDQITLERDKLSDMLDFEREKSAELEQKFNNTISWIETHRVGTSINYLVVILLLLFILLSCMSHYSIS